MKNEFIDNNKQVMVEYYYSAYGYPTIVYDQNNLLKKELADNNIFLY